MSAALRILPFTMTLSSWKRGGRLAALRARFDQVALRRLADQDRRVFARFGNRGGFPIAGAQPWPEAGRPIYRRAVARNRAAVIGDADAWRQPVGADRAARQQRQHQRIGDTVDAALATGAVDDAMATCNGDSRVCGSDAIDVAAPAAPWLPACMGRSTERAGHGVDFVSV